MKKHYMFLTIFLLFLFINERHITYGQDLITPSHFSPLTWEEHIFLNEDKRMVSILIITFFVNETFHNTDQDDLSLEIHFFITNNVKVLFYPTSFIYKEIEGLDTSFSNGASISVPQKLLTVRVYFNEKIKEYKRYSFALIIEAPHVLKKKTPFFTGNVYYQFDYTVWIDFLGDDFDSISTDLFKTIIEGERFEREFPRLTITLPNIFMVEDITPDENTRTDGLPYSYGIYQEKQVGDPCVIDTGFLPGIRITKPFSLKQNESLSFSFDSWPLMFDDEVIQILGDDFWNQENYHTIGWFNPPSHIYIESIVVNRNRIIVDIISIVTFISIPPTLYWYREKFTERKKHRNIKKKKKKKEKTFSNMKIIYKCVIPSAPAIFGLRSISP